MAQSLGSLAVGSKVKDTSTKFLNQPIIWLVADKNHSGYPSGSVTLITERSIALRPLDAKEAANSNADRQTYGNNRYSVANIRQWLNSDASAGAWYSAQHSADAPPTTANIANGNAYNTNAGFLNAFSAGFKAAMLDTTLTIAKNTVTDGGGSETITNKVFLASNTEVGLTNENSIAEGSLLALFSTNASRIAYVTTEGIANSNYASNPANNNTAWNWWLRTPNTADSHGFRIIIASGVINVRSALMGYNGVRPLCNISSSIFVSDTVDGDGCYTIIYNSPPTAPPTITPPSNVYSGVVARVQWGASTDPDGDSISYRLERSYNGGSYTQVYSGATRSFDDNISPGMNTIRWRVKAADSYGNESGYITSTLQTVIHNQPPTISGTDGNLGIKSDPFSYIYTVSDPDGDTVSVVEKVDGQPLRTYNPTLGASQSMEISGNNWIKLLSGNHTLTVTATDTSSGTVTRTMSFVKQTVSCGFTLAAGEIISFTDKPNRMTIDVVREVAAGAVLTVEVCNNGFDASPTWEDATPEVLGALAHVFTNTVKTATNWGVSVRVTLERNNSVGNCRIFGVGGYIE
jgi:hypothetical protein